ncbi:MAG TPA: DUF4013 domain-containing protein [Roseiflexaceae bacterium]|nr:DUF4013 domain-containing protein [Roseiflexaceae bacterium]
MDIGRAFGFVTEDEEWVSKILLGGVILLIPIVGGLALFGYLLKTARNVMEGSTRPLPRWENFGDLLMRGLHMFVIQLVYLLPMIILYIVTIVVVGLAGASNDADPNVVGPLFACLMPLVSLLGIASAFLAYVGLARYVAYDQLSEAFKFREVIGHVRSNASLWLMLLVTAILAGLVGGLGIIACGIGVLFTGFYSYCVIGHALGQVARQLRPVSDFPSTTSPYQPL